MTTLHPRRELICPVCHAEFVDPNPAEAFPNGIICPECRGKNPGGLVGVIHPRVVAPPMPTLADLTLLVDDHAERVAAHARLLGGDDHSLSGTATTEAEREAIDARTALLAAIGMLTGGEG